MTFVGKCVFNIATAPGVLFHDAAMKEPLQAINFPSVTSETKLIFVNLFDFSSPIILLYFEVLFPFIFFNDKLINKLIFCN